MKCLDVTRNGNKYFALVRLKRLGTRMDAGFLRITLDPASKFYFT